MSNFDENEPLEIVQPVITEPAKVRRARTVPEVGQNELAEFAQRLLGRPLETDMQRAFSLIERMHRDNIAVQHRLIDGFAAAPGAFDGAIAYLTGDDASDDKPAPGTKPAAAAKLEDRIARIERLVEKVVGSTKPADATGTATKPAADAKAKPASADDAKAVDAKADAAAGAKPRKKIVWL